jgi:uncharacterized protein (DUF885 family)
MLYQKLEELYTSLAAAQQAYAAESVTGSSLVEIAESAASNSSLTESAKSSETAELAEKSAGFSFQLLTLLQNTLSSEFPLLPGSTSVTVKEIPDALLDYTAPAYYFTPRISLSPKGKIPDISNIIYVSPDAEEDALSLFTTLAHEGYPGHMFQNVYFLSTHGVSKKNVLRYCMDFEGYSEGWAMYAELLSYDYAAQALLADSNAENANPTNTALTAQLTPAYITLCRLSRELQICVLCILDIRIHNDGAQVADITPLLSRIGIKDPETISNVYSYLINEPGTYLKYYAGYLELLACRDAYMESCTKKGMSYSDKAFHTVFLSHGPDTYTAIQHSLQ